MYRPTLARCILMTVAVFLLPAAHSQMIDNTYDRVQTTLNPGFKRVGTIMPRSAREVGRSNFAIGCEMLPRDYGNFENFKEYIAPLGIKRIRIHAGWAKCEKVKGVYDFEWLDKQVNYCCKQGLDVLLETSYGNSLYPGGGGPSLGDGLPRGEEALKAWDKWVEALAIHYKGKVKDWATWNEPDGCKLNTPEILADNNIRTAEMIKKHIPDARIAGLVAASPKRLRFIEDYMKVLKEKNKTGLFEWMIYHDYTLNPDRCYSVVQDFKTVVHKYAPGMKIWQGESGATSSPHYSAAISSAEWNSELTQAKWNARRMLGDLGHDVESLIFTFYDPAYDHPERYTRRVDPIWIRTRSDRFMKRMGLIKCNEDFKVLKVKMAYYTLQHIASVFDSSLERVKDLDAKLDCGKETVVYGYRQKGTQFPLTVYWDSSNHPDNDNTTTPGQLTVKAMKFVEPVWVDVVSGAIYEIPADRVSCVDGNTSFKDMPVYDAPTFITEKTLVIKGPYSPQ